MKPMAEKLTLVEGLTCPACEQQIVDALVQTGARDARADSRCGEVVLEPAQAGERALHEAVEGLGDRVSPIQSLSSEPTARARPGSDQWTPLLLLLPAICCGAPLLLAAAAALGLGTWLAANRFLVVSTVALVAAAVLVAQWLRGRRGQLR
jgi:hypothetical protein